MELVTIPELMLLSVPLNLLVYVSVIPPDEGERG
jgi:hypothetical protein